jgi:hypothetical protein
MAIRRSRFSGRVETAIKANIYDLMQTGVRTSSNPSAANFKVRGLSPWNIAIIAIGFAATAMAWGAVVVKALAAEPGEGHNRRLTRAIIFNAKVMQRADERRGPCSARERFYHRQRRFPAAIGATVLADGQQ